MSRALLAYVLALAAASAVAAAAVWFYAAPPKQTAQPPAFPDSAASAEPAPKPSQAPSPAEVRLPAGVRIQFTDRTAAAGITFEHYDGRTALEYIMDETGSGVAWLDYDQDGLLDLFLVQGYAFLPPFPDPPPTCKLYKNLGGGRFRDVTAEVGLAHVGCGQGVAVGDIDNDGYPDLFLTCYGKPNVLYHNVPDGKGGRKFVDVTVQAGLAEHPAWRSRPNYSTSACFLDYNNDGLLDLFVASYVQIDLQNYPACYNRARTRPAPCEARQFAGTRCVLYRNNGNGTFTDVSHEAGIDVPGAKALGVVALDLDDDGKTDLFVANDGVPNFLFRNLGNGRFEAQGPSCGCAVNLDGIPQGYRGVDAEDLNGDGRPDLFVTAFARETNTFFRNEGHGQFLDATYISRLGPPGWNRLGFGTCLLDVDHDGSPDVLVSNGHVNPRIEEEGDPNLTYRQKVQLFLNDGRGRFQEVSGQAGTYFQQGHVGRGLAYADYDNDGHMDLALNNHGEPAVLLHNDTITPYHWIRLHLEGARRPDNATGSNRDAVGARVTLHASGRVLVRHRKGGGSYLSAHDPRLLVGLGPARQVDRVEIRWPSGQVQQLGPLRADRGYRIREGQSRVEPIP